MNEPTASARIEMEVPPEAVYQLVSDLPGLASLAREFESGKWLGGAQEAAVGVRFRGHNRGAKHSWSTTSIVTDAEPGQRFAFDVYSVGLRVSRWVYDIEPTESGCRVEQRTWDLRPAWFRPLANFVAGVYDRAEHNRRNMEHTLLQVKATAEAARA